MPTFSDEIATAFPLARTTFVSAVKLDPPPVTHDSAASPTASGTRFSPDMLRHTPVRSAPNSYSDASRERMRTRADAPQRRRSLSRVYWTIKETINRIHRGRPFGNFIPILIKKITRADGIPWFLKVKIHVKLVKKYYSILDINTLTIPICRPAHEEITILRIGHGSQKARFGVQAAFENTKSIAPASTIVPTRPSMPRIP